MRLARNVLRVVGAVTDLVVPPKALLTDPGFAAAQLNEHEAEHDGLESSHTSAPGQADGPVVAGTPAAGTPHPAAGASTSTAMGGGAASVGNQPLPGAVATPGAGQPPRDPIYLLHDSADYLNAVFPAHDREYATALITGLRDLAAQFAADDL